MSPTAARTALARPLRQSDLNISGLAFLHRRPLSRLGDWAVTLGLSAGISIGLLFALRNEIERRYGKQSIKQRVVAGVEIEDLLYLVGPVTWLGWLVPLIVASGIGAPLYLVLSLVLGRRRAG